MDENDKDCAFVPTGSENMKIQKAQVGDPTWSELPSPVVENIYSFLDRTDQISMSLVCRNWREQFSSPSLWRKVTFSLPILGDNTEPCPDVVFARRYGAMFYRVKIAHKEPPSPFSNFSPINCMTQLKFFWQAMTSQSNLLSISFDINFLIYWDYFKSDENYCDFSQAILNFFKSQNKLQCVRFGSYFDCVFKKAEATEILKVIFANNLNTLRCLHLLRSRNCLIPDEDADITVDDDLNFLILMNLEILEIHYTKLFENMILSFFEYRDRVDMTEKKGRLKEIKLHMIFTLSDDPNPRIDAFVWKYLKNVFPCLRINFKLHFGYKFKRFIHPHMPLRALDLDIHILYNTFIGELLHRITSCEINKYLEVLKLHSSTSDWDNFQDLIRLINACPELKMLEFDAECCSQGLDVLFESWLKNRPVSLRVVQITTRGVLTWERKKIYTDLIDFYAPLLQPLKLSFLFYSFTGVASQYPPFTAD